jgi:hypothetical protein
VLVAARVGSLFVVGVGAIFGALVLYGAATAALPLLAKLAIVVAYAAAIAALAVSIW